jgi:Uma2 family endonuclease
MSAADLLDHPDVRAHVSPISVEQYHQFPEFNQNGRRTELIRGVIFEKMPKSPLHANVAKYLYDRLLVSLPEGFAVRGDQPLTLLDSEPEPDVAVVLGRESDYWDRHPETALLVIEVAITTVNLDREKVALYGEAGVREYWIVLPRERKVEVYRQPKGDTFAEKRILTSGLLACESVPAVSFDLDELFARVR